MTQDDSTDDALRAAMHELAESERAVAPSFEAVRARRVQHVPIGASVVVRLLAAGVMMAAGIGTYNAVWPREASLVIPGEVVALMAWQPSTDFLLKPHAWDVVRTTPDLHSSILDSPTVSDTSSGEDR